MQQFVTFLRYIFMSIYFWYNLQMSCDGIWSCGGQINTPVVSTNRLDYALCSFVVWVGAPRKNVRKAFTA